MIRVLAAALAAFIATSAAAAGEAEPGTRPSPDNNAYFSLIRTESGQAPPIGWTRLPVRMDIATIPRDGFFADAFYSDDARQIVIAFRRLNPIPLVNAGTYDADAAIVHGLAFPGYEIDLRTFVQAVTAVAAEQTPPLSTEPDNVFVTGNSLGAYGAQLAAKEFHYGGVGFAGPGIPGYRSPPQHASNFVNYLIWGGTRLPIMPPTPGSPGLGGQQRWARATIMAGSSASATGVTKSPCKPPLSWPPRRPSLRPRSSCAQSEPLASR